MKIKKMYQGTAPENKILNTHSDSQTDVYSCNYINKLNTYSTEEHIIGTWIDGKPIYRKTISIEINTSSNITEVPHNISNLDSVIKYEAFFKEGGSTRFVPQFYYDMSSTYAINIYLIGTDTVQIVYGTWAQNLKPTIYATLYYTKTTD